MQYLGTDQLFKELAEESSSHHSISSKSSGQVDCPQPNLPDQQQSFENPAISEQ